MDSVSKARQRLNNYPLVFAKCTKQAAVYARCVLFKEDSVKKDDCVKEFEQFTACLRSAAKDLKTRI